ncbi:phage tail terminator-like protein [Pyxidicoccus caerfyrddinensis]|uniref:phage tail terminator-like protein n=1 Tax=Pyxidicoccus caerfyrddinensis TaxID=2709663 RepID=UPI0013DD1424|nr:phage tail terminator-like protein [Pyxidicoccus caerfyrddinensis]
MSTVLLDIQQALELHAQAVLAPVVGQAVAYPNVPFTPAEGTPWAKVDHLPARTAPAGAGVDSQTRRPGVFQVSLYFPYGQGTKACTDAAQAVCDGFKRGTSLTRGATTVRVQSVSPGPGGREDTWWAVPVSVWWLVHSQD